jgi:hypothetical protein
VCLLNQCVISDASYKQYRFSMGAPDAEAKFSAATEEAKLVNRDAVAYPMIYVSRARLSSESDGAHHILYRHSTAHHCAIGTL